MISRMFARAGREARHLSSVYFQEYNQSTAPSYYLRGDGGAWGIRSLTMYCTVSLAHSLRLLSLMNQQHHLDLTNVSCHDRRVSSAAAPRRTAV